MLERKSAVEARLAVGWLVICIGWLKLRAVRTVRLSRAPAWGRIA